jgi:hypothetical protein
MSARPLFHFFAVTQPSPTEQAVLRIRTDQHLQAELAGLFGQQAVEFFSPDDEVIPFDGGYQPDDHEIFLIDPFTLTDDLVSACRRPNQCADLVLSTEVTPTIKSVFAAACHPDDPSPTVYFQAFNRTQLIGKGFTILHSSNTFHKLTEAGLTLGPKVAAVFKDGKLYFRSFALVSRFLDLKGYLKEASNEEIEGVLSHSVLTTDDAPTLAQTADSWMRKRFAALQASGILDQITARRTANKAEKYGLTIQVRKKGGKDAIVFPADKKQAKRLLTFLNEGYYQGELTDRLYQTNSQRAVPQSS